MTTDTRQPEYMERVLKSKAPRAEVARVYASLLRDVDHTRQPYWVLVNQAILTRFKMSGLIWIKREAWRIYGADDEPEAPTS